jgi:hypothetical protein
VAAVSRADAGLADTFGTYSYESDCATAVDPVTILFFNGNASTSQVWDHSKLSSHGTWSDHGPGKNDQKFYVNGSCGTTNNDSSATSRDGNDDRWHMRWRMALAGSDGWSYSATPHFDDGYTVFGQIAGDCVHQFGFTSAKNEIYYQWYQNGAEHSAPYNSNWGNTMEIEKCDEETAANWSGWVYYFDMSGS